MSNISNIQQIPTISNISNLSLEQLFDAANREANLGDESFVKGLSHYRACGEYLIAAKAEGKEIYGEGFRWSLWLKDNWKKSHDLANRFMRLAKDWEKIRMHSDFSENMGINSAFKLLAIQPETVEVEVIEKEVIKEKIIKEVEKVKVIDTSFEEKFKTVEKELLRERKVREELEAQIKKSKNESSKIAALEEQIRNLQKNQNKLVIKRPEKEIIKETVNVIPGDYEELKHKAKMFDSEMSQLAQSNTREKELVEMKRISKTVINITDSVLNSGWIKKPECLDEIKSLRDIAKKYL